LRQEAIAEGTPYQRPRCNLNRKRTSTHEPPSKTFTDPRLCAAIVDRLTFNGTIIETGTDSYRLASTRARAEESAKAS
ncbi:hypothetical protein ACFWC2_31250, partial [Streptomyces diastaticus]